jgi:hypothetical protein
MGDACNTYGRSEKYVQISKGQRPALLPWYKMGKNNIKMEFNEII